MYCVQVICDNQTFYQSKLHRGNFTIQEMKEMKGLRNVGTVREFRPKANMRETIEELLAEEVQRPIIGRTSELKKFQEVLDMMQVLIWGLRFFCYICELRLISKFQHADFLSIVRGSLFQRETGLGKSWTIA